MFIFLQPFYSTCARDRNKSRNGGTPQWSGVLTALTEDLSLVSSTHVRRLMKTCHSRSGGSDVIFLSPWVLTHMYVHAHMCMLVYIPVRTHTNDYNLNPQSFRGEIFPFAFYESFPSHIWIPFMPHHFLSAFCPCTPHPK